MEDDGWHAPVYFYYVRQKTRRFLPHNPLFSDIRIGKCLLLFMFQAEKTFDSKANAVKGEVRLARAFEVSDSATGLTLYYNPLASGNKFKVDLNVV